MSSIDDTKFESGDIHVFKDPRRKDRVCVIINDTEEACMVTPISTQDKGRTGPYIIHISSFDKSAYIDLKKFTITLIKSGW